MPLYPHALAQIREQLEKVGRGEKAPLIVIGVLTDEQRNSINRSRADRRNHLGEPSPFPPIDAEIVNPGGIRGWVGPHVGDGAHRSSSFSLSFVIAGWSTAARRCVKGGVFRGRSRERRASSFP